MAEYIERERLFEQLNIIAGEYAQDGSTQCLIAAGTVVHIINDVVREAPTADVAEVRHGEWEFVQIDDCIICSECKNSWNVIDNCTETFNYCPNCGAKMDGKKG